MLRTNQLIGFGKRQLARPRLVSASTRLASSSSTATISQNVTIPEGCNLFVAAVGTRHAGTAASFSYCRLAGVDMTAASAWVQSNSRLGTGIYYYINPPTGSQTFTFDTTATMSSYAVNAMYLRGNLVDVFANNNQSSSSASSSRSFTFTPETSRPFIISVVNFANPSTSNTFTYTNLTQDMNYLASGSTSYSVAINDTLNGAGSTTFTTTTNDGNDYINGCICEFRMIGV